MSTTTLTYPNIRRDRQTSGIGLIAILVITSVALIAGAILVIVLSPTWDADQADLIPVAVQVPTPPTAALQPSPSETLIPSSGVANEPSVMPVPVPTP